MTASLSYKEREVCITTAVGKKKIKIKNGKIQPTQERKAMSINPVYHSPKGYAPEDISSVW